jgi:hypothetical protein
MNVGVKITEVRNFNGKVRYVWSVYDEHGVCLCKNFKQHKTKAEAEAEVEQVTKFTVQYELVKYNLD